MMINFPLNTVIWILVTVFMGIMGWFAKAIIVRNGNGSLKKLIEDQTQHRFTMEQHCKNSEKNYDQQIALLNKSCDYLGQIASQLEIRNKDEELIKILNKISQQLPHK